MTRRASGFELSTSKSSGSDVHVQRQLGAALKEQEVSPQTGDAQTHRLSVWK